MRERQGKLAKRIPDRVKAVTVDHERAVFFPVKWLLLKGCAIKQVVNGVILQIG